MSCARLRLSLVAICFFQIWRQSTQINPWKVVFFDLDFSGYFLVWFDYFHLSHGSSRRFISTKEGDAWPKGMAFSFSFLLSYYRFWIAAKHLFTGYCLKLLRRSPKNLQEISSQFKRQLAIFSDNSGEMKYCKNYLEKTLTLWPWPVSGSTVRQTCI